MVGFEDFFDGVRIDFINFDKDKIKIEGCIDYGVLKKGEDLVFNLNEIEAKVVRVERKQREITLDDGTTYDGGAFEVELPFDRNSFGKICAKAVTNDSARWLDFLPHEFTRLSEIKTSYSRSGSVLYSRRGRSAIAVQPHSRQATIWLELRFLLGVIFYWRLKKAQKAFIAGIRSRELRQVVLGCLKAIFIVSEMIAMIPRTFFLRVLFYVTKRFLAKPIWLISDRGMAAGDNGEALFRYIMKLPDCPADVYFVISKKSKDYQRLSKIGPVLNQDSLRYKKMFLLADKVISSQADVEVTNPFLRQKSHFVGLYDFDFIFLQHGIIRHDLSSWLNRFSKNIHLFVTSAQKEYDSILNGPYYYSKENILLSGLPRYDLLENSPKDKLILAPTYRKSLLRHATDRNGSRPYDTEFKHSEYRNFYNNLMNDERIIEALSRHNMTGELYLHPVFASQIGDFDPNNNFVVKKFPYDYKKAFKEGSLMVTDYSSVVFDFAYLKKPVIYSQFDKEDFFSGHIYKASDFFSDTIDGFGPIAKDYKSVVEEVVRVIESNCIMRDKYIERTNNFFYWHDRMNSERVYTAIYSKKEA